MSLFAGQVGRFNVHYNRQYQNHIIRTVEINSINLNDKSISNVKKKLNFTTNFPQRI